MRALASAHSFHVISHKAAAPLELSDRVKFSSKCWCGWQYRHSQEIVRHIKCIFVVVSAWCCYLPPLQSSVQSFIHLFKSHTDTSQKVSPQEKAQGKRGKDGCFIGRKAGVQLERGSITEPCPRKMKWWGQTEGWREWGTERRKRKTTEESEVGIHTELIQIITSKKA